MKKNRLHDEALNLPAEETFLLGSKRSYVSLFSSAGVGCYGFSKSDYECIATNELLEGRLDIQRANKKCRFENGYISGDIRKQETKSHIFEAIAFWKQNHGLTDLDVVMATPPCQGMSVANYKKTDDEQIRNSLVVEAIKIIKELRPKIFIFENVRAFLKTVCTDISGRDMSIEESINLNLGEDYYIYAKIINFKDYGIPSSRPRTIVIGTRRDLKNISPLNLFPTRSEEISLSDSIGDLPRLAFGEKDSSDYLHFARPFPEYMLPWIENLAEGESAFNQETERQPYKIDKSGSKVKLKGSYMGNKYRRLFWNKPGACIATRNDQLASQDTIHPSDNRVLSIRELMRLMTIPPSFRWTTTDSTVTAEKSDAYLKANELNIRRCIGEAVPTYIIAQISDKIRQLLDFEDFVSSFDEESVPEYLADPNLSSNFYIHTFLKEQQIEDAKDSGAFYTPQCVVFDAIKDINIDRNTVRILEPAVGLGAFIPQICSLFSDCERVIIDAVEINEQTIEDLRHALHFINVGSNVTINFIHSDFLTFEPEHHYDLVISNPPYGKAPVSYPSIPTNLHRTKNLFALFMIRFREYADEIVCIIPKNFVMADEYASVRNIYENIPIVSICDFGVRFFKKVFVEIISIHFSSTHRAGCTVTNYLSGIKMRHPQGYIYHDKVWLLYRNAWFDNFIQNLELDIFDFIRDRQITKRFLQDSGHYWVLKSKNILDDGTLIHIPGYDKYLDDISHFGISKYANKNVIIMPNFTYNLRASRLPENCIPNGSIAILIPKNNMEIPDLTIYASDDFRHYYAIVKSFSKFTLNIDNSSIYYIGYPNGTVQ